MAGEETREFVERGKLEALLKRLAPAQCWKDETLHGYRCTRWWHLSPTDLDMAKEVVRERILELQARARGEGE